MFYLKVKLINIFLMNICSEIKPTDPETTQEWSGWKLELKKLSSEKFFDFSMLQSIKVDFDDSLIVLLMLTWCCLPRVLWWQTDNHFLSSKSYAHMVQICFLAKVCHGVVFGIWEHLFLTQWGSDKKGNFLLIFSHHKNTHYRWE